MPYLHIDNICASYGKVEVLHGISVTVEKGEIVTILGANGAGKTTTLHAVSGLVRPSSGAILFEGEPIHTLPSHRIVERGISQSPEGRRVFSTISVQENLLLGAFTSRDAARNRKNLRRVFDMFPRLFERKKQLAGTLSGGEQQMLAIGRALMASPKVLLLDEPSLGLAPILVRSIFSTIRAICETGLTIVLVEQNARAALKLADRGYVMEAGRVALSGTAESLLQNPDVQNAYLGGSAQAASDQENFPAEAETPVPAIAEETRLRRNRPEHFQRENALADEGASLVRADEE